MSEAAEWWNDRELTAETFAGLIDWGEFDHVRQAPAFIAEPMRWSVMRSSWLAAGRPVDQDGYDTARVIRRLLTHNAECCLCEKVIRREHLAAPSGGVALVVAGKPHTLAHFGCASDDAYDRLEFETT